jgi:hypothetical protein
MAMNFIQQTNRQMATKKHNIIVLSVCAAIAAIIPFIYWNKNKQQHIESKIFRVANGWGYDILVNGKLLIHQESVPAVTGNDPFKTPLAARQIADLVVKKMEKDVSPAISTEEIEYICPLKKSVNGQRK